MKNLLQVFQSVTADQMHTRGVLIESEDDIQGAIKTAVKKAKLPGYAPLLNILDMEPQVLFGFRHVEGLTFMVAFESFMAHGQKLVMDGGLLYHVLGSGYYADPSEAWSARLGRESLPCSVAMEFYYHPRGQIEKF